ncbi:MAG: hypothetical protein JWL95_2619 [Gemmatimonadetes bacterium]|nr:hypothetical protein [Gemmatimonadota bacterium]
MADDSRSPLARLRKLCLALAESHEVEAWGEPTFRVNNKLFAMYAAENNHHGAGRAGVWIKSAHVTQDMLVRADPDRYFAPPYVGPKGWVGAYLDKKPDWEVVGDLLLDAYNLTIPRSLKKKLDAATAVKSAKTENVAKPAKPAKISKPAKSAKSAKSAMAAKSATPPKKRR